MLYYGYTQTRKGIPMNQTAKTIGQASNQTALCDKPNIEMGETVVTSQTNIENQNLRDYRIHTITEVEFDDASEQWWLEVTTEGEKYPTRYTPDQVRRDPSALPEDIMSGSGEAQGWTLGWLDAAHGIENTRRVLGGGMTNAYHRGYKAFTQNSS